MAHCFFFVFFCTRYTVLPKVDVSIKTHCPDHNLLIGLEGDGKFLIYKKAVRLPY